MFASWARPRRLDVLAIQMLRHALYRKAIGVQTKQFPDDLGFLGIHLQPGAGDQRPAVLIAATRVLNRYTSVAEDVPAVVPILQHATLEAAKRFFRQLANVLAVRDAMDRDQNEPRTECTCDFGQRWNRGTGDRTNIERRRRSAQGYSMIPPLALRGEC